MTMRKLFKDKHSIIIRMPNWLGDNIMCLPAVAQLKNEFPDLLLKAMCPLPVAPIWKLSGLICEIYGYESSLEALSTSMHVPGKNDIAIVFPNSFSSALSAFFTGSNNKIGYSGNLRNFLLTHAIPPKRRLHQVDEYYFLLFGEKPEKEFAPSLKMSDPEENILAMMNLNSFRHGKDRLIAIAPGAAWSKSKKWSDTNYILLIEELLKDDYFILLVGLDKEIYPFREYKNERIAIYTGSLDKIASLLSLCYAAVGNDSGLMHLASALGCYTIIIYGATDWRKTYPRTRRGYVLSYEVPCQPCWQKQCPRKDYLCLTSVRPWHVLRLLQSF